MQANPKHPYLVYGAIALFLIIAMVWSSHDKAKPSKGAMNVANRSQVLMFGNENSTGLTRGTITEAFIPPAKPLHNTVMQRLREMRVRFRQLDPRVHVAVTREPESVRALGNTLSKMLASSYLATSTKASEYGGAPTTQAAAVTLVGSIDDRPLIFQLVRALSPYLSGAVLVQYDETKRAGTLQLKITGAPAFYPNGAVQLPSVAAHSNASSGSDTPTTNSDT